MRTKLKDGYNLGPNSEQDITQVFLTKKHQLGNTLFTELCTWAWIKARRDTELLGFKAPPPRSFHNIFPIAEAMTEAWEAGASAKPRGIPDTAIRRIIADIVYRHRNEKKEERE